LFNQFLFLRQLPALGQCLATLAGALPVAFLEPLLNMYNPCSVFNTKSARERAGELLYFKAQKFPNIMGKGLPLSKDKSTKYITC